MVFSKMSLAVALTVNTVLSALTQLCSATQATIRMWLAKASAMNAQPALTASMARPKTAWLATTAPEFIYNLF